ncbi:MAG: CCA tRNA nucleotidyltransferase [Bacteroidetes bacterium]|nr:CCA tRNA nucleotidyltransferase [Bacteroidota bacterium]
MTELKTLNINEPILLRIGELADSLGIQAFVVGGYVRDLLLGTVSKDIDVMVIGDPIAFSHEVERKLGATGLVIFEKFRTAQMTVQSLADANATGSTLVKLEIVGARRESYDASSRKPQVEEATLEEDLSRRDFTMNAMAVSINQDESRSGGYAFGELVDPFDGEQALSQKIIETPLEPQDTFSEDPLRILRAIRFACRFEFSISNRVRKAIVKMSERLRIVSQERITDEFMKVLSAAHPSVGLKLMQDTGVMKIVFPEISDLPGVDQRQDHHHKDVFLHTLSVVDNLARSSDNVWLRFTGLVHDIAKPETKKFVEGVGWTFHGHDEIGARWMKKIFQRMRQPMDKLPYVEKLIRLHLRPMSLAVEGVTDSAVRRLLFEAGEDFEDLMRLCRADITSKNKDLIAEYSRNYELVELRAKVVEGKDRIRNWKPPINGDEIMEMFGIKPGREVGVLKKAVESAVLDGLIPNDHDAAVDYLKSNQSKLLSGK